MATEPTPVVTTSQVGEPAVEPTKVTFSAEQQDKIQQLIDSAVARVSGKANTAHDARVAELTAQLETLKATPKVAATTEAQAGEYKAIVEAAKAETERYRQEALTREREVQTARAESQEVRKEVAIANAAASIPFFNLEVVKTLTKNSVAYDTELNQFVVKGPNGQIRYDSTLEKPLTLEAFYTEYASQNKYLVRSVLASGTGSTESSRANISSNGAYAVTDIFGSKSSSAKASDLMKTNPAEYQRLKAIARAERIIA